MKSNPSSVQRSIAAAKLLATALLLAHGHAATAQNAHTLPLVLPDTAAAPDGLVRIINRSASPGAVTIHAIDDTGQRFGPVTLSMGANKAVNISSAHLEKGSASQGLSGGVGDGAGYWRLELDTTLDVEALSYVRSADGSLAAVHDVVANRSMRHHVPTFNPGSNLTKRSQLRLVNTSGIDTDVVITALDDAGAAAPGGEVSLTLPADEARTLSAQVLEAGGDGFTGRFGDGAGKWQVFVSAGRPIQVMSLLASAGNLSNLSSVRGDDVIRGGPKNDRLFGGNGDDVFDPGDNDNSIDLVRGSAGDDRIVYTGSGPTAYQHINYGDLGTGITATIDGVANRATVDKGTAGTDTIVDVANPLNAAGAPPYGGLGIYGTPSADVFDLTLDDGQWMQVAGQAGADTINIHSGSVRIDYSRSPGGVNVNLGAGRTRNDGHGGTDTINGRVWGVRGSDFSDTIVGSGNHETFKGRLGNDTIDGGGGFDRLDFRNFTDFDSDDFPFSSPVIENLNVDLSRGTATGTWKGSTFSYTISNIERVDSGDGNDVLTGNAGNNSFDGGGGDDTITSGGGDDNWVQGSAGNDRIVFTDTGYVGLGYQTLESGGITATIDGAANRATVNKGAAGADTIVDIADPLGNDGFTLHGTPAADVFNLRIGDGEWMQVEGRAGDDTFNVQSSNIRVRYRHSPAGIHVDLGAGRAYDDGYGDTDTISSRVSEIQGSDFADTIIGSGRDESFIGRAGNDTIDGGGGRDRLRFDRSGVENVVVDLPAGTARGTWNGEAFSYRISNIEWVRGSSGDDVIIGDSGNNTLEGRGGDDVFVFERRSGNDYIADFSDGDVILLRGLGISKSDVMNNAGPWSEGTGVWIDLTRYGGGRIDLGGFNISNLDASDFLL